MRLKANPVSKALTLALVPILAAVFLSAQDFQIRTRVDLVVVPVSVKNDDNHNHLVSGLTKEDFIVYEDGQKQTISVFSNDPVPISAAILVDTGLSEISFQKVHNTFPALAEAFSDFDEVTVYRFDKFVTQVLDFTGDKLLVRLLPALETLTDPAPTQNSNISSGPFSAYGPGNSRHSRDTGRAAAWT